MKFFLHIGKKEHRKRLERYRGSDMDMCAISMAEVELFKKYDRMLPLIEEMLEATDREHAPWTIVEAEDQRFASGKVLASSVQMVERGLASREGRSQASMDGLAGDDRQFSSLRAKADLAVSIPQEEYRARLEELQGRVAELQCALNRQKVPTVIVFEGWDAAGKGGAIQRLTAELNPRGYEVVPVGAPTEDERAHHYLWRFYRKLPPAGHMRIFDRSWYGRVLVERVEGLCPPAEWRRAYQEINSFERMLVEEGAVLVKVWMEIDRETQLRRFQERAADPRKQWKITEEDWRNREKWDLYERAVDEMLFRTSTAHAPWTIVESNDKYHSRVKTLETVVRAMETAGKGSK
jgi:polyphosphate:AMP phosphotransferase